MFKYFKNKKKIKQAYKKVIHIPKSYSFQRFTSLISFEVSVWNYCKPDKKLANEVMEYVTKKLPKNR